MTVNQLMEILFNISYLIVIYILVFMMISRFRRGLAVDAPAVKMFIAAFLLLAVGDTGHVGFRVVAYFTGGIEANKLLLGIGSMSTALTVTVFYMLMAEVLRIYSKRSRTPLYWCIMAVGIIRLGFMLLPGNNWGGEIPLAWSYSRNAMLTFMGLAIAGLYLREGHANKDRLLTSIAVCIFISYGFYLPVILFVHIVPSIGMLMIPKTCAYVAAAVIGYRGMFKAVEVHR